MLASSSANNRGFAVYVHWPFCLKKCPYCDFNSHVARDLDEGHWRQALVQEVWRQADQLGPRRIDSIFFGGGTPSLMAPDTVTAILQALEQAWGFSSDIEITLEANPTSVEAEKFATLAAAGVNRLSLGLQSLSQAALEFLGREHSVDEALAALILAKQHFPRVSFDLIYARKGQTVRAWEDELSRALELAKGHLSLYQLTIEPGTAFFEQDRRGTVLTTDEDVSAELYEVTQTLCQSAGYDAYEISNYAQAGQESRHNLVYWRYGEYVGIGPGAHGRPIQQGQRMASQQIRGPGAWLAQMQELGHGDEEFTAIDAADRLIEMVLMGLRMQEGISLSAIEAETGISFRDAYRENLADLIDSGVISSNNDHLRATPEGRPVLNAVLAKLLS